MLSDIELIIEGETICAHRIILVAAEFFQKMLQGQMKESRFVVCQLWWT
jgi:hypothetical protein